MNTLWAYPLYWFQRGRSLHFHAQKITLNTLAQWVPGRRHPKTHSASPPKLSLALLKKVDQEARKLLWEDSLAIQSGTYPAEVLKTEKAWTHFLRIPRIITDGMRIERRRRQGKTTQFSARARAQTQDLPKYYQRNFHFQTDGYLSNHSAELYEHQVEVLFSGTADAMRRLGIPALQRRLRKHKLLNKKFNLLELAAGTGRSTLSYRLAFPLANITATDLSEPYLERAAKRLQNRNSHTRSPGKTTFLFGDACDLPFKPGTFDVVCSVFLHHELPEKERKTSLRETRRVLKKGGYCLIVDSIQKGDEPEFDALLSQFPIEYHEPFYRNYSERPLDRLLSEAKLKPIEQGKGFLSKWILAQAI